MTVWEAVEGSPFGPEDVLDDPRRVEEILAAVPAPLTLKGMFIAPLVDRVGRERYEAMRGELLEPPPDRYQPLTDYPQQDHRRLMARVAELEHPELPQAEALRRLARHDVQVLAGSAFGRMIMAAVGGPSHALSLFPVVYARVAPGMDVTATRLAPDRVRLEFNPVPGSYCYQLGQIEGAAAHYGASVRTQVYEAPSHRKRFDVALRWAHLAAQGT